VISFHILNKLFTFVLDFVFVILHSFLREPPKLYRLQASQNLDLPLEMTATVFKQITSQVVEKLCENLTMPHAVNIKKAIQWTLELQPA